MILNKILGIINGITDLFYNQFPLLYNSIHGLTNEKN